MRTTFLAIVVALALFSFANAHGDFTYTVKEFVDVACKNSTNSTLTGTGDGCLASIEFDRSYEFDHDEDENLDGM